MPRKKNKKVEQTLKDKQKNQRETRKKLSYWLTVTFAVIAALDMVLSSILPIIR